MDVFVFGTLCDRGAEHTAAYGLLAYGVKQVYGLRELPAISREEDGKPYFADLRDICFNISHSYGCAVCALHDRSIGIDVELLRSAPKRLSAGLDDRTFFCRWTAKEATVKREGRGIAALLRGVDPDALCCIFEDRIPGFIVSVCPSYPANIQFEVINIV